MNIKILLIGILGLFFSCSGSWKNSIDDNSDLAQENPFEFYLTSLDQSLLFEKQDSGFVLGIDNNLPTIEINEKVTYQEMDGFGFSLTGGSAYHIYNLPAPKRHALLMELFDWTDENIGVSYLRVSLGASDLDAEVFSYNDLPEGERDMDLEHFSIDHDRLFLIPLLKEILIINPEIKIMASPWSPPTWMKSNNSTIGGSLLTEYYKVYADYFVKYLSEMQMEGIPIDAITVQNEPLHPGNNPSLLMLPEEQSAFVKDYLGPAFEEVNIQTKIIIYDHNADRPDYPISILNDEDTRKYVDGSAFHLYGGEISNLSQVHEAHPDKNLYFTEQWIGAPANFSGDFAWHVYNLIIGAPRNWCKTVLEWNLAADENQDPHTPGGCDRCLGALTIDGETITRNPAYYIIAHASKFVRPGSVRIDSNSSSELPNVAYKSPVGDIIIIVQNNTNKEQEFNIKVGEKMVICSLDQHAVGTFVLR